MSLIARHLEANGIPTVVIGTARDIVESAAVARFLFVDFPLGSPCGEPYDDAQQKQIFQQALDLLENATQPQTTVDAGYAWSQGDDWKATVFTPEQPYLSGDAEQAWLDRKEAYRRLKRDGDL